LPHFTRNPIQAHFVQHSGTLDEFQTAITAAFGPYAVITLPAWGPDVAVVIPPDLSPLHAVSPTQWFGQDEYNSWVVLDDGVITSAYTQVA
jgi:hypothetical protein